MADSIKIFENSLRDYLVDAHADSYNTALKIQYKYNNLKVFMEPKKERIPHFFVSVGISEACYGLEPVEKISGSLATDDRYVILWASRPNINGELQKHWTYLTNETIVTSNIHEGMDDEDEGNKKDQKQPIPEDDNFMPEARGPRKRPRGRDIQDSITGIGLKRQKYTYEERRKMEEQLKKSES